MVKPGHDGQTYWERTRHRLPVGRQNPCNAGQHPKPLTPFGLSRYRNVMFAMTASKRMTKTTASAGRPGVRAP
jgi:hypothetical protein